MNFGRPSFSKSPSRAAGKRCFNYLQRNKRSLPRIGFPAAPERKPIIPRTQSIKNYLVRRSSRSIPKVRMERRLGAKTQRNHPKKSEKKLLNKITPVLAKSIPMGRIGIKAGGNHLKKFRISKKRWLFRKGTSTELFEEKMAKKADLVSEAVCEDLIKSLIRVPRLDNGIKNPHLKWSKEEDYLDKISALTTETGRELKVDLEQSLSITLKLGSDAVKAKRVSQTLPLLLNFKEVRFDNQGIKIDSKIDLVCVIDISASMCGPKIGYVKKTMKRLLKRLKKGHRLAIVLFDDRAQSYMNFKQVTKDTIPRINELIDSIRVCRGTNITAGVNEAQKLLGARRTKNQSSCFFC